ncbi:MAG: hypothetical protein JRH19_25575 [Deltaproteobacteria bacterium]|nr:hypothetical protein [Deltaproteobacteria bacterium]
MTTPIIRPAEERDLPDLVRIYNHYVVTTRITFDTQAFSVDARRLTADSGLIV